MPSYRSREYRHLVAIELAISQAAQPKEVDGVLTYPDLKELAAAATALTRVIDQKRIMRGQPAPKPIDVSGRARNGSRARVIDLPAGPVSYAPAIAAVATAASPDVPASVGDSRVTAASPAAASPSVATDAQPAVAPRSAQASDTAV